MTEVVVSDVFTTWYEDLDLQAQLAVGRVVDLLAEKGPTLQYPYSSAIESSAYALRELRIQHQGQPFRVLYAFDPKRQAVLLLGGDKTGRDRFYEEVVPVAERLWEEYLKSL